MRRKALGTGARFPLQLLWLTLSYYLIISATARPTTELFEAARLAFNESDGWTLPEGLISSPPNLVVDFKDVVGSGRLPADKVAGVIGKSLVNLGKITPTEWESIGESVRAANYPAFLELHPFRVPFSLRNAEDSLVALHQALLARIVRKQIRETRFYIRDGAVNIATGNLRYRTMMSLAPSLGVPLNASTQNGPRFSLIFPGIQGRPLPTSALRNCIQDARRKAAHLDVNRPYSGASEYYQPVKLEVRSWTRALTNLDAIEALDLLDRAVGSGRVVGDGAVVEFVVGRTVQMRGYFQWGLSPS